MPTIALYVPAHQFRLLGSDPERVREVARAAVEVAAGLGAEVRGTESVKGGQPEGRAGGVSPSTGPMAPARSPSAPSPVLPSSVREFRPDPKKGK